MNARSPSTDEHRRGVRQVLRNGMRWAKDAILCASDSRQPSGSIELLPATHIDLPSIPDEYATTLPLAPLAKSITLTTNLKAVNERKYLLSGAWDKLSKSLNAFESSEGLFPPLKKAVSDFIQCLGVIQQATSNCGDQATLADEVRFITDVLNRYPGGFISESNNGSIANIARCIEREVAEFQQPESHGRVGRFLDASRDAEDVIRRYRRIESLFRRLQCDLTMRTHDQVQKQLETTLLRGMPPVDDARYDSSYSNTVRRHRCTVKTREAIHQNLQGWTMNPKSEDIYWMNGMAGTGKTTIAYSFCEWLEETNRLGAGFFCSRISATCRSLSQIVPTIAYQLAQFSHAFRSRLCAVLNDNPDAGKLNVVQQFEKLINRPMLEARDAIPDCVVIVIDALDECDDNYSVRLLLDVLLKFAKQLPVKFFVASRPEPIIRDRMMSQRGSSRFIVYLHDIEQSIVEEDIKKYLTEALSPMDPHPSLAQIEMLAKRSRNLFIYAATVVRYVYPDDMCVDSSARLESMLDAIDTSKGMTDNKYEDLDLLYTMVLSAVFKSRWSGREKGHMRQVLWTVVCAREPISHEIIASLTGLTERQVKSALHPLRSVVHVPENRDLVSTLHASFPEYMLDESRSKEFSCTESKP